MISSPGVRIAGPLVPHVEGLWSDLLSQGYTQLSSKNLLRLMSHFSRWLAREGFDVFDIGPKCIEKFLKERRRIGYTMFLSKNGMAPILRHLKTAGVISCRNEKEENVKESPHEQLLQAYKVYLLQERAITETSVRYYQKVASAFLSDRDLDRIIAADVTIFMRNEFYTSAAGHPIRTASALRSFLRFLHMHGDLGIDLSGAVVPIAGWRHSGLPKVLSTEEVKQLLQSCDRRTHVGRRNFAVLLLLSRLALRAKEVATLTLNDVDWAAGEIIVHGKGGYTDRLPLPMDVGKALASYLRHSRPQNTQRQLLLRSRAPYYGISSGGIVTIVRQASKKAGLAPIAAHRLRHTVATQMLRQRVPLSQIAQVLRHRSVETTAIYAKVDQFALQPLAQPWPGGVS